MDQDNDLSDSGGKQEMEAKGGSGGLLTARRDIKLQDFPDVFTSWNDTSVPCDRRLSRAARKVVKRHILQSVFRHLGEMKTVGDKSSVHDLLQQWLASILASQHDRENCPLAPDRDMYKEDEIQTHFVYIQSLPGGFQRNLKVAYPQYVLNYRRDGNDLKDRHPGYWYQCGYCGKTFVSQYYLDLHMATKHHSSSSRQTHQHKACPATAWCKLVGMANCHQQALLDEPYYDRGSGGWDDGAASKMIQHKWSKISHSIPCSTQQLQSDCRSILSSCGLMDLQDNTQDDDWVSTPPHTETAKQFCQTLTCPLQQSLWHYFEDEAHDFLLGLTSTTLIPSVASFQAHWESTWRREADHHSNLFTWTGTTVLTLLCVWILHKMLVATNKRWSSTSKRNSIPSGQRLLHKRGNNYRPSPRSSNAGRVRLKRD
jgi:Zinc finger, C2H2 type